MEDDINTPITIHGGKIITKKAPGLQEEYAASRSPVDE
jgi:hypothetical protein